MNTSTDSLYYKYNPEKRNIFIEMSQSRNNMVIDFFLGIFSIFTSQASAIVEVFLRKRFGERYITLAQSIGIFFVMIAAMMFDPLKAELGLSWFLFALVFLAFSIRHRLEIKKYGTAYHFKRFSLSDGEIAPFWWNIIGKKFLNIKVTYYTVVTVLEPAIPVFAGIILTIIPFTRPVGVLLFFCGILYAFRNFDKARQGRNWVLDNIDKKISDEMKYDVFIGRKSKKDTKGVYLPIELPEDEETRQALYNAVDASMSDGQDIWVNDFLDEAQDSLKEHLSPNEADGAGNG